MSGTLDKARWIMPASWVATKRVIILDPRFPNRDANAIKGNKFHPERVGPGFPRFRAETLFEACPQKGLLLRDDFTADNSRFITGEMQIVVHGAGVNFFDDQPSPSQLTPIDQDARSARGARNFHAAVGKYKTLVVILLRFRFDRLVFFRPALQTCADLVRSRGKIDP